MSLPDGSAGSLREARAKRIDRMHRPVRGAWFSAALTLLGTTGASTVGYLLARCTGFLSLGCKHFHMEQPVCLD